MEIYLDKRAVKQIRLSVADAIEEGDTDTLKDDIIDAFPEERIETLEQLLGGEDFIDLVGDIIDEWSGDDVDELLELLETQLADRGIDLKLHSAADDDDLDDDVDDLDDDDELDDDELDEYVEPGLDDDL